jgi:hypothetical protein
MLLELSEESRLSSKVVLLMVHGIRYHKGRRGKYCRERLAEPELFHKKSLRTIVSGAHKVIVGCPIGEKFIKQKCAGGTRAQALLHPLSEGKCG